MTLSAEAYFDKRDELTQEYGARKKEPRYLAVINKDSCTSCQACASVCPVDCIYEVVGRGPAQSYHQIDTARCIGCQLCYRIPQESTDRYTLEVCPWNAIDMLHNPNVKLDESVLAAYYAGGEDGLPWAKLEEYGYQLFLNGELRIPHDADDLKAVLAHFERPQWFYSEQERCAIVRPPMDQEHFVFYETTPEGQEVLTAALLDYALVFLD